MTSQLKSLYTWRDHARTKLFVIIMCLLMFVLSVLPWRLTFTLIVLHQFSKRFRDPDPGLVELSLARFYDDLPTFNIDDAVYSRKPVAPSGTTLLVLTSVQGHPQIEHGK